MEDAAKALAIMEIVTAGILAASKPRVRLRIHNCIRDKARLAATSPHKLRGDGVDAEAGAWVEERLPGWMG